MTRIHETVGFIGAGNMAEAMIGAMIRSEIVSPEQILVSDISRERIDGLCSRYSVSSRKDNFSLMAASNVLILAVKPQQMTEVLSRIGSHPEYSISSRKLVISIAAGISISTIENLLYPPLDEEASALLPILRVMPNTPALVLKGISGMCQNRHTRPDDIRIARTILESMGKVIEFTEDKIDAVTALSGSGPAYVFYLIESMIAAGVKLDLTPDDARNLTLTTIEGALKLIEDKNESPEQLRKKVTSPGGTTEAAFKILEGKGVKEIFVKAIQSAQKRSKELSS